MFTLSLKEKMKKPGLMTGRTSNEWEILNPILLKGEQGWETDTNKTKIGDGFRRWKNLDYSSSGGSSDSGNTVKGLWEPSVINEPALTAFESWIDIANAGTDQLSYENLEVTSTETQMAIAVAPVNSSLADKLVVYTKYTSIDPDTTTIYYAYTGFLNNEDDFQNSLRIQPLILISTAGKLINPVTSEEYFDDWDVSTDSIAVVYNYLTKSVSYYTNRDTTNPLATFDVSVEEVANQIFVTPYAAKDSGIAPSTVSAATSFTLTGVDADAINPLENVLIVEWVTPENAANNAFDLVLPVPAYNPDLDATLTAGDIVFFDENSVLSRYIPKKFAEESGSINLNEYLNKQKFEKIEKGLVIKGGNTATSKTVYVDKDNVRSSLKELKEYFGLTESEIDNLSSQDVDKYHLLLSLSSSYKVPIGTIHQLPWVLTDIIFPYMDPVGIMALFNAWTNNETNIIDSDIFFHPVFVRTGLMDGSDSDKYNWEARQSYTYRKSTTATFENEMKIRSDTDSTYNVSAGFRYSIPTPNNTSDRIVSFTFVGMNEILVDADYSVTKDKQLVTKEYVDSVTSDNRLKIVHVQSSYIITDDDSGKTLVVDGDISLTISAPLEEGFHCEIIKANFDDVVTIGTISPMLFRDGTNELEIIRDVSIMLLPSGDIAVLGDYVMV